MTVTAQAPLDEDTRRLIDAVVQDLVAAQSGAGSRDVGPDATTSGGATPLQGDQDSQRFFGGLLSSLITQVVPKVAPHILGMLQQRRRELGIPEQRDVEGLQRDFGMILSALIPNLIKVVPDLVSQLAGRPAPRSAEEETERFFPLLGALIPAIASCVPSIISAFNRQRGADSTPPSLSDPEAQRFFGALISAVAPALIQAAPGILGSIFGGRDVTAAPSPSSW